MSSALLHALVLSVLASAPEPGDAPARPPAPARAVEIRSVELAQAVIEPTPQAPAAEAAVSETPAPNSVTDAPSAARSTRHYFSVDEVDSPAVPQPDWDVDAAQLMALGVQKLSVEILIDEYGMPERCRVMTMEPPVARTYASIAGRLCKTRLRPAMRNGAPVPSIRHVEMVLGS